MSDVEVGGNVRFGRRRGFKKTEKMVKSGHPTATLKDSTALVSWPTNNMKNYEFEAEKI